ncbi:hypothetical protein J1605_022224 [Eschrichtius robustus]|uniref:Uncharacterized protein n=1 Tax=Eschrichtius robustus TaxID=9764 RepID=A0AB34HAC8_ESCRO|nr:hypothetical protein J1605_022224 [Eschrichtius robustus]
MVTIQICLCCASASKERSHQREALHAEDLHMLSSEMRTGIGQSDIQIHYRNPQDGILGTIAFNKNNLILEERNKYFNPHLTGKTYSNAYFTDLNNYDEY